MEVTGALEGLMGVKVGALDGLIGAEDGLIGAADGLPVTGAREVGARTGAVVDLVTGFED